MVEVTKQQSTWVALGVGLHIITGHQGNRINALLVDGDDGLTKVADSNAVNQESSTTNYNSGFKFSGSSLREMEGVHPVLISVAKRALELSTQDFVFYDGVRTHKEQQANVAKGVSKTLASKHLPQSDGFGWAMDLVPWINGRLQWDWEGCYRIAMAVDLAATEQGVASRIRWGGAWDRSLADFGSDESWKAYKAETEAYVKRSGKSFLDGPHFELIR